MANEIVRKILCKLRRRTHTEVVRASIICTYIEHQAEKRESRCFDSSCASSSDLPRRRKRAQGSAPLFVSEIGSGGYPLPVGK